MDRFKYSNAFCLFVVVISSLILYAADAEPTYTIVAPAKLRPNSDYHVSCSMHGIGDHADVDISVAGKDQGSDEFKTVTKTISLGNGETRIINFEIGAWGPGSYKLIAIGRGALQFRNETNIQFEQKSYSVFVQTDKAIYKPGQLVQFRAIVVNPSLLPSVTGAIDIYIKDAKGNRIKQWNRELTNKGIISKELQLSSQPVLGDWTIEVQILEQKFTKSFTVAEYILPTFDVEVNLPSYATYNKSNEVVSTVKATYTYGKPVKGLVTLTVQPRVRYNRLSVRPLEQFQVKQEFDGSIDIPVDVVKDLGLQTDFFEREIEFFALVEETHTGRKYNRTSILKMYDKDVKVELIKTSKTFKPGLKYTILLKVAYQDDTPVPDNGPQLSLRYGYSYNEENWTSTLTGVPSKGMLSFDVFPPQDDVLVLGMRAEYRGQSYYINSIEAAHSPSHNFIQITMADNSTPKVGQEVRLLVNATEPIDNIVYEVMGRGDIVLARSVPVSKDSTTHEFVFTATHRMAPKARVVVYYVRPVNQEVVADAINFDIDGIFRTPCTVSASESQTKPGANVDIRVDTKAGAYVGLLGLDQSILLLKTGNDITQHDVMNELDMYDGGRRRDDFFAPWYRRKRRSLWWPGSISAGEIFQDSGVVLLSNGLIPQNLQLIYYRNSPVMYAAMPAPMAAMPDAFAARAFKGHSGDNGRSAKVRVRKYFPETWLWETAFAGQSGSAVFSSKAPDTITSWIISAFAMDPVTGLGIAPSSAKVTVFRPFFIQLALPYSIVRGETVAIQAIVFNYMNKAQEAEVSMENKDGDFDFVIASNDANSIESQSLDVKRKFISIPAQDGVAVSFLITPKKLGYIDIKVAASTATAGDGVQRKLLVKAEGQPQYFNKAILVDLRESARSSVKEKVSLAFPKNAVPGSEKVTVSIIGDIMGSSVNNLEDLLRMPYGCGEQNMLNFVPNIVVLDYLSRTKKLTGTMKAKALTNMEAGYQRELTYKRDDGSFSAFGNNDKSGSTWLTSFVLKSFQQAKQHMTIDESVIETCTQWLVSKQNNEGSFDEPGEVHHKAMQGGSGKGTAALTAFVMIALLQDRVTTRRNYTAQISKGEQYLVRQLRASQSSYEIALITYALHLVDSPAKDSAHQKLLNFAKREKELTWWTEETKKEELGDKQSSHFYLPKSSDIEASAYALLTLEMRNEVDAALPVMRWLITQQGENGGFSSTQDTVIGIQALSAIAGRISSTTVSVDATIRFDEETGRQPVTFRVTGANAQVLQRSEAPPSTRSIEFEASGFGTAVASVSWQYNLAVSAEEPAFFLNPQIGKTSTDNYMQLNVCTYYKAGNSTNMAVMEVALPSGYTADVDALPSISRAKEVKRIDTSDGDTNVIIYFDRITRDELCLTVPAHRNYKVANHKPVPVTLYDYYNRNQAARLFYEPLQALMCDACDGDDCGSTCNIVRTDSKSSESVAGINGSSEAAKVASYSLFAFVVIVCNLVTIHSLF